MSRFNNKPVVRERLFRQQKYAWKIVIKDNLNPLNNLFPRQDYEKHYVNNLASHQVMRAKYKSFGIALNNALKSNNIYDALYTLNAMNKSLPSSSSICLIVSGKNVPNLFLIYTNS